MEYQGPLESFWSGPLPVLVVCSRAYRARKWLGAKRRGKTMIENASAKP